MSEHKEKHHIKSKPESESSEKSEIKKDEPETTESQKSKHHMHKSHKSRIEKDEHQQSQEYDDKHETKPHASESKDSTQTKEAQIETHNFTLADYKIKKKLGEGGFGDVFLGKNKKTKEMVVLKQIKITSDTNRQQIQHEIDVHKQAAFQYIVKFIGSFTGSDNQIYIVMEYCSNGNLDDVINKLRSEHKRISEEYAWDILSQLVFAVNFLHFINIVHKDIKPLNVLLPSENEIRIGDFGIAEYFDKKTGFIETKFTTLDFASPEVLSEHKFLISSDVWGIGATVYMLLTLHHPFGGNSDEELEHNIINPEVQPVPLSDKNCSRQMRDANPIQRISLNDLVKIPEINIRIRRYIQDGMKTADNKTVEYLQMLKKVVDQIPEPLPSFGTAASVKQYDVSLSESKTQPATYQLLSVKKPPTQQDMAQALRNARKQGQF
ncbi:MAG: putative AGC family protein kinase [Streblomastix strix]|uniref:non-specific serine/threonine protein kinase n=1 Tax=Streblomastix strix TaxID=222440 RepID=A0A5J4VV04_9EUKA|nr:MAG: putative AGC family protein kinase [Streblomastix strix]